MLPSEYIIIVKKKIAWQPNVFKAREWHIISSLLIDKVKNKIKYRYIVMLSHFF